jgi:hypothetical protein
MAIKFKYVDLTTGTSHNGAGAVSGEARGRIGLGAVYGKVIAVEVKGDDANVDTNAALNLVDAEGRLLLDAMTLDAGDTTFDQYTSQTASIGGLTSTVGYLIGLAYQGTQQYSTAATPDAAADAEGHGSDGVFAKSPVVVTLTAGTDGDVHRVGLWVEV